MTSPETSGLPPTAPHTDPRPGPGPRSRPPRAPGRVWGGALALGAVAGVAAQLLLPVGGPGPAELSGDPELAEAVAEALGGREAQVQGLAVTLVEGDETSAVTAGTADGTAPITADTPFETGSVFKVVTAMTLADLAEDGEVELDSTLGEIFTDVDFASPDVAGVTLEELASHHSGLARMPLEGMWAAAVSGSLTLNDGYAWQPPLEDSLAAAVPVTPGQWGYSNFGFAVLGEALARETGVPYPELARERVLDPLGMTDTVIIGAGVDGPPAGAALPHWEAGARVEPWHTLSYAPAGIGTWSTSADLLRLARGVMDGTAPGMSAVRPAYEGPVPETRLGLAWMTTEFGDGVELVQHSGGTYGSSAFVAVQDDRAVVALSNSFQVDVSLIGARLMGAENVPTVAEGGLVSSPAMSLALTLPLTLLPPLLAVALMVRRRTLVGQRPLDRLRVVSMPLGATAVLLLVLRTGSWVYTPTAVWALALGLVVAALAVGIWYWPRVPAVRARVRWIRVPFFALSAMCSTGLAALMVWSFSVAYF
ncbi:serine hydrolase domain-containing protein [Marinitenerispora sediminis]|uniref:Serine hydrolase n=1 Tax=Marinitenerispora sediminis TaxID=1931232 RepID=A0A368T9X9_9ACTN|nr:serine hydrolase domain-containing protein [Marinitenerispora sediminis]RCV55166.1 serine hydrolase [Marinitenerispora sediminis]RCV61252.1 serine hydrolase [Marinitenerispora sediminis]RCV61523.1 serine hydrolase [Marinitenerispora sediminis]